MPSYNITENIVSVGVLNPSMRVFDIVMKTEYGTSYNAFLVRGAAKTALIETVHLDFFDEYLENIRSVCELSKIDYLILNHNEPDHSGAVEQLLRLLPNLQIFISQAGSIYLKNITNRPDLNLHIVKDGDELDLGGRRLRFLNAPFLHWPDSMFTWCEEEKALFSCDFLGTHFCEPRLLDTRMRPRDRSGYWEAMTGYYAAIFAPFSPYVQKGLDKIAGLDIEYACTSHGPILTQKSGLLAKVRDYYRAQSQPAPHPRKRVPIFYTTAYHNTEALAEAIAAGVKKALPDADATLYNLIECDPARASAELNACDGCFLGSPTINRDAVPPMWKLLSHVDAVNFGKRPVALFGSYGWSGEAFANLRARLEGLRARVWETDCKVVFVPTAADLAAAEEFGRAFAASL